VHQLAVVALVAVCGGCVGGGRFTGGFLTGTEGTTGFVSATFQIGMAGRDLSHWTAELGVTDSNRRPATHLGLRVEPAHREGPTWTASAGAEYSRDGVFGQVTAGVVKHEASLTKESPDVLGGTLFGVAVEAIAVVGGRETSELGASIGAQLSLELLCFGLMR
jgi:hypothetical protein